LLGQCVSGRRLGRGRAGGHPDGFDELDVDLEPVAGKWLLVAFPAFLATGVALGDGQPVEAEPDQDVVDRGAGDRDVVVPLQIHLDLDRAEVVVLPQIDDLVDDVGVGGVRAVMRCARAVPQAGEALVLIAALPFVEGRAADAVVAAGPGDVTGNFLGVAQDRQAGLCLAILLLLQRWGAQNLL
jgi:hypothetical protein